MKGADGVNWVGMKRRKPSYAWLTANDASPESQSDKVELGPWRPPQRLNLLLPHPHLPQHLHRMPAEGGSRGGGSGPLAIEEEGGGDGGEDPVGARGEIHD